MRRANPLAPASLIGHSNARCIAVITTGSTHSGIASPCRSAPGTLQCGMPFSATAGMGRRDRRPHHENTTGLCRFQPGRCRGARKVGPNPRCGDAEPDQAVSGNRAGVHGGGYVSTLCATPGIRTFQQAVELQTTLARTAVEKAMPQTGQVAETPVKLAGDAVAPVTGRMTPRLSKAPRSPGQACPDSRTDGPRPCPVAQAHLAFHLCANLQRLARDAPRRRVEGRRYVEPRSRGGVPGPFSCPPPRQMSGSGQCRPFPVAPRSDML